MLNVLNQFYLNQFYLNEKMIAQTYIGVVLNLISIQIMMRLTY